VSRSSTARKGKSQRRKVASSVSISQDKALEAAYEQLLVLQRQLAEQYATSVALRAQLEELEKLRPLVKKTQKLEKELKQWKAKARDLNNKLIDIKQSTSWRVTKPIRYLAHLGKGRSQS